jgi:hypothetical protein
MPISNLPDQTSAAAIVRRPIGHLRASINRSESFVNPLMAKFETTARSNERRAQRTLVGARPRTHI